MELTKVQIERYGLVGINNQTLDRIFAFKTFPLHFLKLQGLKSHHKVLEIGCGVLRSGTLIIDYLDLGNYSGFDVSKERITEAHNELKECNLDYKKPNLYLADNIDLVDIPEQYDFIIAHFVICFIDKTKLGKTFESINKLLTPNGLFFANVPYENKALLNTIGMWKEFSSFNRPILMYKEIAENNGLLADDIGNLEDTGFSFIDGYHNKQRMLKFWKK